MLVMRPAQMADLGEVQRLAADSPIGVTSLPDDVERLSDKIAASEASFSAEEGEVEAADGGADEPDAKGEAEPGRGSAAAQGAPAVQRSVVFSTFPLALRGSASPSTRTNCGTL